MGSMAQRQLSHNVKGSRVSLRVTRETAAEIEGWFKAHGTG